MSKLICIKGDNRGDEFALAEGTNVIGRAPSCTVTLFDKKCSREHCHIHKRGRYYSVEDLESTNGTLLNGKKLSPGKNVTMNMDDQLRIGKTVLQLSEKAVGNLLTQTAVDVAADMQSKQYDKLLSSAAKDASKCSEGRNHPVKTSFRERVKAFFGKKR